MTFSRGIDEGVRAARLLSLTKSACLAVRASDDGVVIIIIIIIIANTTERTRVENTNLQLQGRQRQRINCIVQGASGASEAPAARRRWVGCAYFQEMRMCPSQGVGAVGSRGVRGVCVCTRELAPFKSTLVADDGKYT